MIALISKPDFFPGEAALVLSFLKEGLDRFHLRKPEASQPQLREFGNRIPEPYRSRVVWHQHHQTALAVGFHHWHFPEAERRKQPQAAFQALQQAGICCSASLHSWNDFETLPPGFAYVFLSPVFNSISKPGYKGKAFPAARYPRRPDKPKVIALGGIDATNCHLVEKKGFDGLALYGSIWNKKDPLESFKKIKTQCNMNDQ